MAIRLVLLIAAICLALAGCKSRLNSSHPAKRVAGNAHRGHMSATPLHPIALRMGTSETSGYVRQGGPVNAPYKLGSGDRLRIMVFGQQNLSRTYRVDAGGFISMPLIGAVEARDISTFQLEERISRSLKRKYVKDPKVTVEVETSRPFFILGEVRNGGQYPYVADMTVQMAVAIAGGFTPRAKKSSFQLTRKINRADVTRMVPPSWKVLPGDTITVKERFF
jgi:polysaccharide export outer membrane protein